MMLFTLCESPVRDEGENAAECRRSTCRADACRFWVLLQVVVVLSGSMEPGFYRGDILFLNMGTKKVENGEIVVFNIDGRDIPIVHRSLRVHTERSTGSQEILTKGDNNYANDRGLYKPGQDWLHKKHLIGRVVGYCPYVGMLTIIMNDYPVLKYLLIGVLGFFVLTSKDEM